MFTFSEEAIINDMTLWPYLSATLTKQKRSRVLKLMKHTPKGSKGPNILVARKRIQEAKYCVICSQENLETYSEVYLHVEHQIPNILICTKHNCFLNSFSLQSETLSNNLLIALSPDVCENNPPVFNTNELLLKVANRMLSVSKGEDINRAWDIKFLQSFGLKKKYILRRNWNVEKLNADVNSFYKELDPYSPFFRKRNQPLISNSLWNGKSNTSDPFLYVLMLLFIEYKLEAVEEPEKIKCINPVCKNFDKIVKHAEEICYEGRSAKLVKIVTCSCGMKSRIKYDKKAGSLKRTVVERGALWTKKLKDGIKQGISQAKLAKLLRVDAFTVRYHATRFGIKHPWGILRRPKKKRIKKVVNKTKLRQSWLEVLNSPNFINVSQARIGNWSVYNKLKDVDLEWLKKTNKSHYVRGRKKASLTDKQLDDQLYEKLLKGYEVLKSSNIRARMSKYLICKSTGLRQSPEHSKRKLPRSRKLLNKLNESVEQNQIRRITMAVEQLKVSDKEVNKYNLQITASIHKKTSSGKAWKFLESFCY